MTDAELAANIAMEAGSLLLELQEDGGISGRALGDTGDRRANKLILDRLALARPDDDVLSEEAEDDFARLSNRRVWIVDPLDGTREFAERRDDWAVHVGLSIDGAPGPAAIALPGRGVTLRTDRPVRLPVPASVPRILTSRTRPAPIAEAVARDVGAQLLKLGSAGAKVAAVLLGEAEAYLHSGSQREWDNLAPVAVALAAGLHCSRLDGAPLVYNRRDVIVPDLLVCRFELADVLLASVAKVSRSPG